MRATADVRQCARIEEALLPRGMALGYLRAHQQPRHIARHRRNHRRLVAREEQLRLGNAEAARDRRRHAPHRIVALDQRAAAVLHVGGKRARQLGGSGRDQLPRRSCVIRRVQRRVVGQLRQIHRRRLRRIALVQRALVGRG